ncbi:VLRF1 family aeRF1-type release factor [Alkalihalobacillus sp. AL-G]|uniref:VLRF1 family aeRF1-type release factor n=1 Tax=Alkalihalobacillus sp. AL-G TaxID=2926399 RepID=UPI00272BEF6E|nr:VLRF1 family aeRF1-type release factor [Alkalihalobacillus sp. AL-G]WLD92552.1 VLRF1 family aeRF1-type release factor [Alkalihalobacillus sp. AL-G]
MKFSEKLNELKDIRATGTQKIMSLYLNTDRSGGNQQGGEWKIKLKNGLNKFEEYVGEMGSHEELKGFRQLKERIYKTITERERDLKRSIVLFATPDERLWTIEDLQIPIETSFHWEEYPVLDQLENLQTKYPYSGIVVINKEDATVLETEMGVLVDEYHYSFEPDIKDWREHWGPLAGSVNGSETNKKDEFQERFEANQQRWLKELGSKITKKAKKYNWKKTYLMGEKSYLNEFKKHLPYEISKFGKNPEKIEPSRIINEVIIG